MANVKLKHLVKHSKTLPNVHVMFSATSQLVLIIVVFLVSIIELNILGVNICVTL